jgi:glycyl-tRNA synthetase
MLKNPTNLTSNFLNVYFDDRGNIGKRYYSQDEIGTPYCVTIDFQTLQDDTVTIRDRDTTNQIRIGIADLKNYLLEKINS